MAAADLGAWLWSTGTNIYWLSARIWARMNVVPRSYISAGVPTLVRRLILYASRCMRR